MDLWVLGSEAAPFLNSLLRESNIQDLCELKGRSLRGGNQIVGEVVFFPHNFPRGAEALSHPCAVHSIPCKSGSGHLLRSRDPVAPSLGFWGQLQQLWVHSQDTCTVMAPGVPPTLRDILLPFLSSILVGGSVLSLP